MTISGELEETYASSDSGLFGPLFENMTSSTKPEVHNILHCRQKMTEPRPQLTCTENLVKLGCAVFDICERKKTDNRQTVSTVTHTGDEVMMQTLKHWENC